MIPINLMTTLQILIDPVEGYYLQQYYGSFSQGKPSSTVFKGILVILCYTVFQYVKKQILPGSHSPWKIATDLLLTLCFLLLLTICLYRDLGIFRIFLAVGFMAIREAGRIIALILPYLTTLPTSFPGWRQIYGHTVSEQNAFFFVLLTVHGMWILIYGFRVLILHVSLNSIRKQFHEGPPSVNPAELQYLLLPALTASCINLLLNLILFRSDHCGKEVFLFDLYPVLRLFVPILLLLSLVSVLYGVRLFQRMAALRQEQNGQAVLEEQLKSMQEYLQEEQRIQSGIRGMKHDMKNTLAVVMQLVGKEPENRNVELDRYLSGLNHSLQELEYCFHTGNAVADALLNMKYHKAILQIPGLHLQADTLLFPDAFHISNYDIGIIIGNALDNALEACANDREEAPDAEIYIKLFSFQKRNLFFIEVENSFHGRLICPKGAEFPSSTRKKDSAGLHGIGLSNIKKAAEKYDGAIAWDATDNIFHLSVMLKNKPQKTEKEI